MGAEACHCWKDQGYSPSPNAFPNQVVVLDFEAEVQGPKCIRVHIVHVEISYIYKKYRLPYSSSPTYKNMRSRVFNYLTVPLKPSVKSMLKACTAAS